MTGLWRGTAPLVLASQSPARQGLLAAAGIPFEICDAAIDERGIEAPLVAAGANAAGIALHLSRARIAASNPNRRTGCKVASAASAGV